MACPLPSHSWFYYNGVSVFSMIADLGTFIIACLVYRNFLTKRAKEKQLEVVLAFIDTIDKSEYYFSHSETMLLDVCLNPTAPVNIFNIDFIDLRYLKFPIYFASEPDLNWEFYNKYHKNILLPPSIAMSLKKFKLSPVSSQSFYFDDDPFIGVRKKQNESLLKSLEIKTSTGERAVTVHEFIDLTKELRDAINYWMRKSGVKNLNF